MPETHVTGSMCHTLRTEIYGMIFPRWALLLVIVLVGGMLATLYAATANNAKASADSLKKAENNDTKFTIEDVHQKETLGRIETELGKQRELLTKIDKKIPDNGD